MHMQMQRKGSDPSLTFDANTDVKYEHDYLLP